MKDNPMEERGLVLHDVNREDSKSSISRVLGEWALKYIGTEISPSFVTP